jgi:NADH dehydrogenase
MSRVVILGSGYSAVWAYRAVQRWLGAKAEITVISDYAGHNFHGFVGDVLGGALTPKYLISPLEECMPKANHVLGSVRAVDPVAHTVSFAQAGQESTLGYDQLIIATGARERVELVPGLGDHGWRLRTPEKVAELLEYAKELQGRLDHQERIVVIGGGFTGTEVAAALGRFLKQQAHVSLVVPGETVIPDWSKHKSMQRRLRAALERGNVHMHEYSRAAEVQADHVRLNNGTVLPADLVIAALGNVANVPAGLEAYTNERGLLKVDASLQVAPDIWAAGDVAEVYTADGKRAPHDALWAIAEGTRAGRNAVRASHGKTGRGFRFIPMGSVATFEPGVSVARFFGIPIHGWLAYGMRQTVFLWFIPSRRNALRIMRARLRREDVLWPSASQAA